MSVSPPHSSASAAAPQRPVAPATFEELASRADDDIDVTHGAALLARDAYGKLDVGATITRFEPLAAPLVEARLGSLALETQAAAVSEHVYGTLGFRGNESDYYDPRNSLLPDVLDRKLGIPITLALVYVEIAQRAGVNARGVSFPGHFLVRIDPRPQKRGGNTDSYAPPAAPLFVDPFFGGRTLDRKALERLLRRGTAPDQELTDEHLAPASPRAVLVRMLINLKWIYMTRGDYARAHLALDRIISLTPDAPAALRERGMLAARLGAVEAARADLSRLLEISPETADAKAIRQRLEELNATKRALN
jgi:regulator of sirC expression with transglutaminase-like and TPR domain